MATTGELFAAMTRNAEDVRKSLSALLYDVINACIPIHSAPDLR
jgi:hypothetical protein